MSPFWKTWVVKKSGACHGNKDGQYAALKSVTKSFDGKKYSKGFDMPFSLEKPTSKQTISQELTKHGIQSTMSRMGKYYEDALAESVFALKKKGTGLKGMNSREKIAKEFFEFIECFYNRK